MDGLLKDKSVVITGAGSGVGRAAMQLFARHGARLLGVDINQASLDESVALANAEGAQAASGICDVSDPKAVEAAVAKAVALYGRLDVMYNNAGVTLKLKQGGAGSNFLESTPEDLVHLNGINVGGVLYGCQSAVRQFRAQGGGGVIVNTASLAGLIGYGSPLYSSTKGAVTTLTRSIAMQVAKENIRINSVCPAAMMTNFGLAESNQPRTPEIEAWAASMFPMGRNIEAMECASVALFLASDLSSNMTGVNIPLDGGMSAGVKI